MWVVLGLSVTVLGVHAQKAASAPVPASAPTVVAPAGTGVEASCEQMAAVKRLTGPAKASFVKDCTHSLNSPATAAAGSCDERAAAKKLAGAAKASFLKKCNATPSGK